MAGNPTRQFAKPRPSGLRTEHGQDHLFASDLDSPGELDLARRGQQGDLAHLPQVNTD